MLTNKDKENILRLHYKKGKSYAAIGRLYTVTRQRIRVIVIGDQRYKSHKYSFENIMVDMSECIMCLDNPAIHLHHIDQNMGNNDPDNLAPVCLDCHKRLHEEKEVKRID